MKNLIIGILAITTVVFATMAFKGNQKQKEAETTAAALREDLEQAQTQLAAQEKETARLQNTLVESRTESAVKATEAAQLKVALTNETEVASKAAASTNSGKLSNMFKTKEMRDMISTQQKMVLGPLIEKSYATFFSSMGLKPDQAATLKDLLVKKSMVDAQMGVSMMAGDADADKRTEMIQQAKEEKDGIDAEIKQFLGDDNYSQFQAYDKTMPERMAINTFKDQLAAGPSALSADQEGSLIQAMGEERQNFKFTTDFYDKSKYDYSNLGAMFTDDKINQFEQEMGDLDKRYLSRAEQILTPDQMGAFQKFLDNQRTLQQTSFKVAAQMFRQ